MTVNCALETLRGATNWGMAQTPPLFRKSPFHRFGVRMNKKLQTSRDRRPDQGQREAVARHCAARSNIAEHRFAGPLLHDRIIGALELVCRRREMLPIENPRVER